MSSRQEFLFRIQRFDSTLRPTPYFQEYVIAWEPDATILDSLIYIKEQQDNTLVFRCSCRSAICGSCAVRVNNKGVLACHTKLREVITDQSESIIIIEPLKNLPLIKDLVVDFEDIFTRLRKIQPWLNTGGYHPPSDKEHLVYPDQNYHQLNHIDNCILCGICYSECPVVSERRSFIGPSAAIKALRFILDSRDINHKGRLQQLMELGIPLCREPDRCPVECPKEISLAEDVMKPLQLLMEDQR
jgi:succinate dehydrogenase/fumarate reductase iron-sulfur protein